MIEPRKHHRPDFSKMAPESQRDAILAYLTDVVETLLNEQELAAKHYTDIEQKVDKLATQIKLIAVIVLPIAIAIANRLVTKIWP